jgi:hypothetical protein
VAGERSAIIQDDYVNREDIGRLILQEFRRFDADYEVKREPLKRELIALGKEVDDLKREGADPWRSDQILGEAKWLLNYRADWERARRKIVDLRASLKDGKDGPSGQGFDGSWGRYSEEWYRKLEPTVDELQFSGLDPSTLTRLFFLSHLTDARVLQDYFWRLQISDIATTGENHRDQLGASQTAFSQLMYKKDLRKLLDGHDLGFKIGEKLEHAYEDFMNQTQHPRTGYWGPWYRAGNQLRMVQDLSFTFHHVKFRKGKGISHLDRIAETTLKIRELTYPNGWKPEEGGKFRDHHNYDVVQILAFCWPEMKPEQREEACGSMGEMLEWCLAESFDGANFTTEKDPFEALYFGVRFLDRVGYWDIAKRFWLPLPVRIPAGPCSPLDLAERCLKTLEGLAKARSERGETIRDILTEARKAAASQLVS